MRKEFIFFLFKKVVRTLKSTVQKIGPHIGGLRDFFKGPDQVRKSSSLPKSNMGVNHFFVSSVDLVRPSHEKIDSWGRIGRASLEQTTLPNQRPTLYNRYVTQAAYIGRLEVELQVLLRLRNRRRNDEELEDVNSNVDHNKFSTSNIFLSKGYTRHKSSFFIFC